MKLFSRKFSHPGSAPGHLTDRSADMAGDEAGFRMRLVRYSKDTFEELEDATLDDVSNAAGTPGVLWIDVVGPADVRTLESLGDRLGLHTLALEDVHNLGQRPKMDDYEDHAFVVMKQLRLRGQHLEAEQVSMFFSGSFVLTVQESPVDDWEPVRERIRSKRVRIRQAGADYLAYALLDSVIDSYFPLLETFGDKLEALQEAVLDQPGQDVLNRIHGINQELIMVRRSAWPHREVVNKLERSESGLVKKETKLFLRDCYDHTVQILDILESYRDLARGLMDLYLSTVSNRMNEVMKVLTVMASIFIPLTFLAGIYGMNFDPDAGRLNMPELRWAWGYPAFWAAIVLLGGGMVAFFRRKNWL